MPKGRPKGKTSAATAATQNTGQLLQVRMSEEGHQALQDTARGVRLETKSALVRALADAVQRKDVRELRRFLFLDD